MPISMNLKKRDKNALVFASVAICIFLALQLLIFPMLDNRETLKRRIAAAEKNLLEMIRLEANYKKLSSGAGKTGVEIIQGENFSLFSSMEIFAGQAGVKDRIAYIRPSNSELKGSSHKLALAEVKLEAITLNQLLLFLYQVETSAYRVNVTRMSVSKTSQPTGFLNAIIQVETLIKS